MRRVLSFMVVLAVGLSAALYVRVQRVRANVHGPAGGSGVIEGVDVNVTSRIATRITEVRVREGDIVKRGDAVVELDCVGPQAELAHAQAQLRAAEAASNAAQSTTRSAGRNVAMALKTVEAERSQQAALNSQLSLAEEELHRAEQLVQAGAATSASLDEARSKRDQIKSQIDAQLATEGAGQAQVESLSENGRGAVAQALVAARNVDVARAQVASADVSVRECTLYAPRDGMVATRILEPGEAVQPGTAILTITDVSEARTRFYLPNAELAAAAPGRKVQVVADAYPGQKFEGTIFYVSPRAEFTPRNVQTREDRERLVYAVEVRIPNQDLRLRSGMPVEVQIEGSWE
jgi:HlyD family secretion protein